MFVTDPPRSHSYLLTIPFLLPFCCSSRGLTVRYLHSVVQTTLRSMNVVGAFVGWVTTLHSWNLPCTLGDSTLLPFHRYWTLFDSRCHSCLIYCSFHSVPFVVTLFTHCCSSLLFTWNLICCICCYIVVLFVAVFAFMHSSSINFKCRHLLYFRFVVSFWCWTFLYICCCTGLFCSLFVLFRYVLYIYCSCLFS